MGLAERGNGSPADDAAAAEFIKSILPKYDPECGADGGRYESTGATTASNKRTAVEG